MSAQTQNEQTVKAPACLLILDEIRKQAEICLSFLRTGKEIDNQFYSNNWSLMAGFIQILLMSKIPRNCRFTARKKIAEILELIPDGKLPLQKRWLTEFKAELESAKKRKGGSRCPTLAMESMTLTG